MSKVIESKVINNIEYELHHKVDQKEYQIWVNRLRNQYYQTVDIPGFRKGKAPSNLVEKTIDKERLEQTILRESLEKYFQEAAIIATKDLDEKGLTPIMSTLNVKEDSIKSTEGFEFILTAELLPTINFNFLKNIKVKTPKVEELTGRMSKKEFISKEKSLFIASHNEYKLVQKGKVENSDEIMVDMSGKVDGKNDERLSAKEMKVVLGSGGFLPDFESNLLGLELGKTKTFEIKFPNDYFEASLAGQKAEFTVTVNKIGKAKYTKVEEVLSLTNHDGHNHNEFKDEKSFEDYVGQYYDNETVKMLEDKWQKLILEELVEKSQKTPINEKVLTTEADRILGVLAQDAKDRNISLAESFATSGIPGSDKKIKDEIEIKKLLEKYIRSELIISSIWNVIYEKEAKQTITQEQIDLANKEITQNPTRFGLAKDANKETIQNYAISTLKKQIAAQWLFSQVRSVEK